jgi:thiamine biosynthesis lipoprotein
MGTVLEIDAAVPAGEGADARARTEDAFERAFEAVAGVEDRLSNWRPESELSRANRGAALSPVPLTRETWRSVSAALALAAETGGSFDPTVGPITASARSREDPEAPPAPDDSGGLSAVGFRFVRLDPEAGTLFFERVGASIDSGGFGKGEALDRAAAVLERGGVHAARLNFGGQLRTFGSASRAGGALGLGRAAVAVAVPDLSGRVACRFSTDDGSLSTSGDAEKPGHIVDPRTGRPPDFHGSASVLADTGLRADALSTALFVMGPARGVAFADERGIPALFLWKSGGRWTLRASRAFPPTRLEEDP